MSQNGKVPKPPGRGPKKVPKPPGRGPKRKRKLLSFGEIAEMVGVSTRTVKDWADQGFLTAVVLPIVRDDGKGPERRVHADEARRFFAEYGYTWALADLDEHQDAAS